MGITFRKQISPHQSNHTMSYKGKYGTFNMVTWKRLDSDTTSYNGVPWKYTRWDLTVKTFSGNLEFSYTKYRGRV